MAEPLLTTSGVTADEMRRLDAHAVSQLGIPALMLMDHAGRAVAEEARRMLRNRKGRVFAVCGGGNNGGDGIVAARWLHGWGIESRVLWLRDPAEWKGSGALHAAIAHRMGVPMEPFSDSASRIKDAALLIDALLGIGFEGRVREPYAEAIRAMNESRKPIIAVDIPSGLNADTGFAEGETVKARLTVTFAQAKRGLLAPDAKAYVGRLIVADIGIPSSRTKT
jgi:NAD(P)H-hydrate epimerase